MNLNDFRKFNVLLCVNSICVMKAKPVAFIVSSHYELLSPPDSSISTVAVCAGSGASVLTGVAADLYITGTSNKIYNHRQSPHNCLNSFHCPSTCMSLLCRYYFVSDHSDHFSGEMSHHEVLDAVAKGTNVILSDHSNSERGFLSVFRERLTVRLPDSVTVVVSKVDRDPLEVVWGGLQATVALIIQSCWNHWVKLKWCNAHNNLASSLYW